LIRGLMTDDEWAYFEPFLIHRVEHAAMIAWRPAAAAIIVPLTLLVTVSPGRTRQIERTWLDRVCDANAERLRNKKKQNAEMSDSDNLLEPGVTVA
jgi:hypothetical protein